MGAAPGRCRRRIVGGLRPVGLGSSIGYAAGMTPLGTTPLGHADAVARPPADVRRFLVTPDGGPLVAMAVAAAGLTLYAWSWLEVDPTLGLFVAAAWVTTGGVWVYEAGVARWAEPPVARPRPAGWRYAVPAVFAATVVACVIDLPTFVRFDVCRTAMQRTNTAPLGCRSVPTFTSPGRGTATRSPSEEARCGEALRGNIAFSSETTAGRRRTIRMTMTALAAPAFAGLCLGCNYPLMDLPPHRCAECGRDFDPADPETVNTGRPVPAHAAWAVGPISWPVYGVALAGAGGLLWRARLPAQPFSWSAPVLWGWLAVAAVWLAWPLVRRAVLGHYGWPARVVRPMGRLHWVVPVVMLGVTAATAQRVPPRVAFAVSRPAMDRLARDVMAHPRAVFQPQRVGAFWAKNISLVPSRGVMFVADDRDAHDRVGFAYLQPHVRLDAVVVNAKQPTYLGHGWWNWKQGV